MRWISRGSDQDVLALMLPATADPNGYIVEKAKGKLRIIPPQGEFRSELEFGALEKADAGRLKQQIEMIKRGAS